MTDDAKEKPAGGGVSWLQTLPGVLTGTAAVLTAIGGLLAVLHQQGLLNIGAGHGVPAASAPPAATREAPAVSKAPVASGAASAAAGAGVQAGHYRFELVGLKSAPYPGATPPKRWLYCTLTVTDVAGKADYVDGQTVRLRTQRGAVLNPENSVNVAVYEHGEATIEAAFVVPADGTQATLLLGRDGDAVADLAVNLGDAAPG